MPREKQAGRHAGGRTDLQTDRQSVGTRVACTLCRRRRRCCCCCCCCRVVCQRRCPANLPRCLSVSATMMFPLSIDTLPLCVCLSVCLRVCVCVCPASAAAAARPVTTRIIRVTPCARVCVLYVCDNCIYTALQRAIMWSLCASLSPGRSQTPTDGRGCD